MTDMTDIISRFESNGQAHVFTHFDKLDKVTQDLLITQASSIDLEEIASLHQTLITRRSEATTMSLDGLEPADFIPLPHADAGRIRERREATAIGENALRAGRLAVFTVAGGQGTRLGFDGPKGTFGVTPVLKKPLFQVFAEKILAARRRYEHNIPWYLMTSVLNHSETVSFFEQNDYFGLPADQVHFFSQGFLPAIDSEGRILMSAPGEIALSPDGHGGALRALVRSGSIARMESEGTDLISYFQVDNPLVRCLDPAFIGFHLQRDSEMSSKMVLKSNPEEKVGVFCEQNGKCIVVEYSDLPESFTQARNPDGSLRFASGSIAIHLLNRDFVKRLGGNDGEAKLPFHLAHKKVPHLTEDGSLHTPDAPNAWKFEMFVFDALPFAKNPLVIETSRADEFSPVKNADGVDSPLTSHQDQLRQFTRWLREVGVELEADASGLPKVDFEISPLFADTAERFQEAWKNLAFKPKIGTGVVII